MTNYSLYSDDKLRELLQESVGIIDHLFESLANRNKMLVEQQRTIDELTQRCERYNKWLFEGKPEYPGGAEVSE